MCNDDTIKAGDTVERTGHDTPQGSLLSGKRYIVTCVEHDCIYLQGKNGSYLTKYFKKVVPPVKNLPHYVKVVPAVAERREITEGSTILARPQVCADPERPGIRTSGLSKDGTIGLSSCGNSNNYFGNFDSRGLREWAEALNTLADTMDEIL